MFESLKYIDYDYNVLIEETLGTILETHGGISYETIINMPFDFYNRIIMKISEIQKERNNG